MGSFFSGLSIWYSACSLYLYAYFFCSLDKFSSMILLKSWSMSLTWDFSWYPTLLLYFFAVFSLISFYFLLIWSRSSILSSTSLILLVRLSFEIYSWVIGFFNSIFVPASVLIDVSFSILKSSLFASAFCLCFLGHHSATDFPQLLSILFHWAISLCSP